MFTLNSAIVNCSLKAEVTSPTGDCLNISWSSDLCPTVHLLVTASNRIIQNVTYRSDTRDVHITGLQQETIYKIQMQCLSKEDEFGSPSCIQTLYHHTDKSSELPDSTLKSNNGEIVLISTIVVSLVLLSALALLIMIRTKLQSQKKNHESMSQTERIRSTKAHPQSYLRLFPAGLRSINIPQSTSQDIAEYCNWRPTIREESVNSKETGRSVSREGLLYVTLDHSHYKKKRKAKKQSREKIVYAELKF
uniref:Fibronectin type-III domain-containing protein n=1 Tax=Biomphalaria glabrata TaxID=6526 RepID=A0A2C9KSR2_BIOGL